MNWNLVSKVHAHKLWDDTRFRPCVNHFGSLSNGRMFTLV